uniref:Uncharacterized protein n=1 Tax=Romanomermis culicivorax TaxID=13658 RepID=A0A915JDB4_ROMCU
MPESVSKLLFIIVLFHSIMESLTQNVAPAGHQNCMSSMISNNGIQWEAGEHHDTTLTLQLEYGGDNFHNFDLILGKSNRDKHNPQSIKFVVSRSRFEAFIKEAFANQEKNVFPHKRNARTLSIFPSPYNDKWGYRIFTNNDTTSGGIVISKQIFNVLEWDLGKKNSNL